MSDEQDSRPEEQQTGNATDMSWDKDRFPTSVAPIVRSGLLLAAAIIAICFAVYATSDEKEDPLKEKREQVREKYLGDGEEEDNSAF